MKTYGVISEFIDSMSGQRKHPGDVVEADEQRAELLRAKGVIGPEVQAVEVESVPEPYEPKEDDAAKPEPELSTPKADKADKKGKK